jgi:tetratricopeptide (TPR) repeat protein
MEFPGGKSFMKSANYHEHRDRSGIRKRFSLPVWVGLLVIGILFSVPAGLFLLKVETGRETPYRYRFSRSAQGTVTLALGKEIAFYQERIRRSPEDGLDRASLASTYLKMARATGDVSWYLLAEQSAQQSLAKLPFHNDGAVLALARVAQARHDFAEAIRLAEQVPGKEEALSVMVTAKLAMGKVDEASVAADALVNRYPALGSLTLMALVNVAQGKDDAAIQNFQQALAAEEPGETGGSIWARTLLGRLNYKRGQLKKARELYQESLLVLPQYPPALLNLAELEVRLGDYQAAERYYSQVFLTSQRSPTVYDHVVMRGMVRVKELSGDKSGAKLWLDKAEARLREDLASFGHRRELARLLLERGGSKNIAEALTLMQIEVRVRRDAETLDTLAWALSGLGRWPEAKAAMQEALRSGIRDPGLFHRAGVIEQALGNQPQALAFFRLVQETDPTFDEQAQRTLGLGVGLLGL